MNHNACYIFTYRDNNRSSRGGSQDLSRQSRSDDAGVHSDIDDNDLGVDLGHNCLLDERTGGSNAGAGQRECV